MHARGRHATPRCHFSGRGGGGGRCCSHVHAAVYCFLFASCAPARWWRRVFLSLLVVGGGLASGLHSTTQVPSGKSDFSFLLFLPRRRYIFVPEALKNILFLLSNQKKLFSVLCAFWCEGVLLVIHEMGKKIGYLKCFVFSWENCLCNISYL